MSIERHFVHLSQVYLPCVLETKKRYVGYMYETLDQRDPVFDAKGIETVRRDSCPAVPKVSFYTSLSFQEISAKESVENSQIYM